MGVGRWVWVWAWRIQLLYKTLSLFVQSVIFCHSLSAKQIRGCREVCVGVVVRSCGCVSGEVCVR